MKKLINEEAVALGDTPLYFDNELEDSFAIKVRITFGKNERTTSYGKIQQIHKMKLLTIEQNTLAFLSEEILSQWLETIVDTGEINCLRYTEYRRKEDMPVLVLCNGSIVLQISKQTHTQEDPSAFLYGITKIEENQSIEILLTLKGITFDEEKHYIFSIKEEN